MESSWTYCKETKTIVAYILVTMILFQGRNMT